MIDDHSQPGEHLLNAPCRKVWTARERECLRRHYGPLAGERWPASRIADVLGVTVGKVHQAARRFRVCGRRSQRYRAHCRAIKRLHARGLSDRLIARKLGLHCAVVHRWRTKLGLPPNGWCAQSRRQQARRVRRTLLAHGVRCLTEANVLRNLSEASRVGWPDASNPTQASVLQLLYELGPQSRRQLAESLGLGFGHTHKVLSALLGLGLVGKPAPQRRPVLYALVAGVCPAGHRVKGERGDGAFQPRTIREPRRHAARS